MDEFGDVVERGDVGHSETVRNQGAGDLRLLVSNVDAGDTVYLRVSFVPLAALWQLGLIAALGGPLLLGAKSGAEPTVREVAKWRG